ncbi:serine protease [Virgisporangium ochraceum]|uniref:Serine protease n=1 Tax=Virgisporangium ochraceum TaxID=65505 RepID=A0A8J4ECA2_9ACTN|nr:serine protease [Virgisporangium ochraceum]GIJ66657.1 serine protease [Virgisporangium ochraceum]
MRGRITATLVAALAVGAMVLVPSLPAQAAEKRLPIKTGPKGLERIPGSGPSSRIVGGTPVSDGVYPFQAALLYEPGGTNDYQRQFCGGSLISPWYVLTAAHCVEFFGDEPDQVPLEDLRVVVGRTVLTSSQGERREAFGVAIHPQWNPDTFSHDVAIIALSAPVTTVTPVLLVTPGTDTLERPGTRPTVTGWGNTIAQPVGPGAGSGVSNFPDRMQQAKVPIVSRPECRTAYGAVDVDVDETMLCAGLTNRDSCQGDSGGPLFFKATGSPDFIQLGITSWGFGCGATGFPGVYTRLGNEEVGDFVLEMTGGVPVTTAPDASAVA